MRHINKNIYRVFLLAAVLSLVTTFLILLGLGFGSRGKIPIKMNSGANANTKDKADGVQIIFGGDVMLGRSVYGQIKKHSDPLYPFRKIAGDTTDADLTIVNLENPIIENCPESDSGFKFCSGYESIEGLTYAGIDIVNLANNHTKNYGQSGLDETIRNLDSVGILSVGKNNLIIKPSFVHSTSLGTSEGRSNLLIKHFDQLTIGFIGFDFTLKFPTGNDYQLIKDSDIKVDLLIVSVHWGVEYTSKPTYHQRQWARQMIVNGADVIAGHHPHWVQEIEYLNKNTFEKCSFNINNECVPVYYSLGNLVFDQIWSEETKKGILLKLTLEGSKIADEEILDTYMSSLGRPEIMRFK